MSFKDTLMAYVPFVGLPQLKRLYLAA